MTIYGTRLVKAQCLQRHKDIYNAHFITHTHTLSHTHMHLNILNWVQHLLDIKTKIKTKLTATASKLF